MYEMPCGCKIPLLDEKIKDYDGLPSIYIDYENIKLDCPITWTLFAEGKTKGVFQLEKSLGQNWSSQIKPCSIEELSAVISLIRPGSLKAIVDGKSMTQHYVDRKDGKEPYQIDPPVLESTLRDTYGVIVYQEQAMAISKDVAGFNLKQADSLRKAMGKKDAALMAKVRKEFIKDAKTAGIVSEEQAELIFDVIEKSNRYSFNASHACSYGLTGYWTAYLKAHFPLHFYCAWLRFAENKQDEQEEVSLLVNDAKAFDIKVRGPSVFKSKDNFTINNGEIVTGLANISRIGTNKALTTLQKVKGLEGSLNKPLKDFTWLDFLLHLSPIIDTTTFTNLCATGTFDHLTMFRQQMLFEYNKIEALTGKHEIPWLQTNISQYKSLGDAVIALAATNSVSSGRKAKVESIGKVLKEPPSELKDTDRWIADVEKQLIGVSISCSKLDQMDLSCCNAQCVDFKEKKMNYYVIGCVIDRISEYIPKTGKIAGKKMLYLTLSDSSGTIEAVMFPGDVKNFELLLFEDNTIIASGKKSDKGSFTINKVEQL